MKQQERIHTIDERIKQELEVVNILNFFKLESFYLNGDILLKKCISSSKNVDKIC